MSGGRKGFGKAPQPLSLLGGDQGCCICGRKGARERGLKRGVKVAGADFCAEAGYFFFLSFELSIDGVNAISSLTDSALKR